jgi:uncharacterized protein
MTPHVHLFSTGAGWHALAVDGSRIYDLDEAAAALLNAAGDGEAVLGVLASLGANPARPYIDGAPLAPPPVHALALAISSTCNLACSYCYAQQGSFGGAGRAMSWPVAKQSIDRLLEGAASRGAVTIAFLGGEPLVNRALVRQATQYASDQGREVGVTPRFSITSNGTLLDGSDVEFFEAHGFAVTISLDGIGQAHDRQRPFRGGAGSYDRIIERVMPLLERQRRMQVSARVTVTPYTRGLPSMLDQFIRMGFHSVGFSPVLATPDAGGALDGPDLSRLLSEMIDCATAFERRVSAGERYPFSNMESAMQQLHRGTHRPYPCGAGAGYLGVSASGGLYACHRFVDDERAAMGTVLDGPDNRRRMVWLSDRRVDRQTPCSGCWARYLCGGGCHHEAINRGRPACEYIRGWLHHCLQAYVRLLDCRPGYFGHPAVVAQPPA